VGRYTRAYTGTLALVCAGSMAFAVHAHDRASRLGELEANAFRWETWASNERWLDARAYAKNKEVARRYRLLARQVERSQRRLQQQIAATRSLRRTVIVGTPIVSYVHVRKVVPVAAAPVATAPTAKPGWTPPPDTASKAKPLVPTKPKKPGAAPGTTTPAASSPGATPAAPTTPGSSPSTPSSPGTGTTPATTTSTTTTGTVTTGAPTTPPPPTAVAPVNTGLPGITGIPQSSKSVSATPGSWTGSPTSFQYQWQRCDASGAGCVVVGAGQTYTCVPSDIDKTLRVAVEATNAAGSAVAVSAASPKTKPS
jgi:hypothetical protein